MGGMIEFKSNGDTFHGYLASPPSSGPGVVVIQEWWGLVDHIKDVCDRFARAGFNALAPDIYQGESTDEPEEAGTLMMALRVPEAAQILTSAVDALVADPKTLGERVGTVGFCMGGQLSLFAATLTPKVGACVNCYGIHPHVQPALENLNCKVLGIFGSRDPMTSPDVVNDLSARLDAVGKEHEFITYDADHAFFNDTRPEVYHADAATDAWARMVAFFRNELI